MKKAICKTCGKEFKQTANQLCCSKECKKKYTIKQNTKVCEVCCEEFVAKNKKQKCCSLKCSKILGGITNAKNNDTYKFYECKQCSKKFRRKRNSTNTFCSRDCSFKWKEEHKLSEDELKRRVKERTVKTFSKLYINECVECGKKFTSKRKKKRCSKECEKKYYARKDRQKQHKKLLKNKSCIICGKDFIGMPSKSTCSNECKDIHKKNLERRYRRKARQDGRLERSDHIRRAKHFGVEYEKGITITKIKKRDGEKCLICGVKTLSKNVPGYHKRNATIGHLIPVSLGGSHTLDNVQLECMRCNTKLGATPHGQLRIKL